MLFVGVKAIRSDQASEWGCRGHGGTLRYRICTVTQKVKTEV